MNDGDEENCLKVSYNSCILLRKTVLLLNLLIIFDLLSLLGVLRYVWGGLRWINGLPVLKLILAEMY